MPDDVKLAKSSLQVAGVLLAAAAFLFLFVLVAGNAMVGLKGAKRELLGNALLGWTGAILAVGSGAAGTAFFKVAGAVSSGERWARVAGAGLGILLVPAVPMGTVLGYFVIRGLLGKGSREWFSQGISAGRNRTSAGTLGGEDGVR